jgi:glycerol-3-phosphate dehydrogenase
MSQLATLGPLDQRRRDLETLGREEWDLVVVGGGIVGAGVLLDAASRGLRAALVEQEDIASGTSSKSSRLIHGGLRYLEQYHVGLVREALSERSRLMRLAPHLVRPEKFLFPVYGVRGVHRLFYGSGMVLYDLLGSARDVGRSRHLGPAATLELAPDLRRQGLRGGIVYHDAVEDDARYALAVVRTALSHGALAVTRVQATGVREERGTLSGINIRDGISGDDLVVRSRRIVDATGVWAARADRAFAGTPATLVPSRGSHLIVRRDRIPLRHGLTIRVPGKVVFIIPWNAYWLIGTTDHPDAGIPEHVAATPAEVDELLATVNGTLRVDLGRGDLVGTYAGFRPLVGRARRGSTVTVSREHSVQVDRPGLVRVSGGKYTTYRVMAADAVDAALGHDAKRQPSATDDLAIIGGSDAASLAALVTNLSASGVDAPVAERLVARHGTEAAEVVELGRATGTLRRIGPGIDKPEADIVWAVRRELALGLDDVLARRTRLAQELPDRGSSIVDRVSQLLATELGWEEPQRAAEVRGYLISARAEFGVPGATDG